MTSLAWNRSVAEWQTTDDGDEASFLVLEGNPIEDWNATRRLKLRVKQGVALKLQATR